eukprot:7346139-Pyramimonas_sp.AAC.1
MTMGQKDKQKTRCVIVIPWRPPTAIGPGPAVASGRKVRTPCQDSEPLSRAMEGAKDGTDSIRIDTRMLIGVRHARVDNANIPKRSREVRLEDAIFDGAR